MRLLRPIAVLTSCALVGLAHLAAVPAAAVSAHDRPRQAAAFDVAAINSFVSRQVERNHLPGVALGVVEEDRIVDLAGFGTTDGRHEVTPRTPFLLASMSKPLTATAVMQLVASGRVRLEGRVHDYLPEFEMADRGARKITVRQLLQHTSGLPITSCDTRVGSTTLAQYVAELRTVHLSAAPGERHAYCSGNYNVLGRLIETVSEEPFGAYLQRHVFSPLDMPQSFSSERDARGAGLARGHRWLFGRVDMQDERYNTSQLPSGFLISSAEDMTHFLVAQLNGGSYHGVSVLAPKWVTAMQAPGVPVPGSTDTYGLGWRRGDLGGVPTIQHYGDNYYFHGVVFLDPSTRRGAVILVNGNGVLPLSTAFKTLEAGVARLVDGLAPEPDMGLTLRQLFVVQDLVIATVLAAALWPLLRLRHWTRRLKRDQGDGRRRRTRTALRIGAELLLPLALLAIVRLTLGLLGAQSWNEGLALFPDTGLWLWTVSLVILLTGTLRLVAVVGISRGHSRQHRASDLTLPTARNEQVGSIRRA